MVFQPLLSIAENSNRKATPLIIYLHHLECRTELRLIDSSLADQIPTKKVQLDEQRCILVMEML